MIRQAQSYFAGAASSAALIAAAIAAFVLLASLTAFHAWPVPHLGGSADTVTAATGPSAASQAAGKALAPAPNLIAAARPVGPPVVVAGGLGGAVGGGAGGAGGALGDTRIGSSSG